MMISALGDMHRLAVHLSGDLVGQMLAVVDGQARGDDREARERDHGVPDISRRSISRSVRDRIDIAYEAKASRRGETDTYLNESAPACAFAATTAVRILGVMPGVSASSLRARLAKSSLMELSGRPASRAAGITYSGVYFVSLFVRIVAKMAVATDAPPLRMEPSAPSAAPMSSVAQDRGASAREQISIMPTEKVAMNMSATPLDSSPGWSTTIAAEKTSSMQHEATRIQRVRLM